MTRFSLEGKKGLIVGIANDDSIAYGCAKALKEQGAELAITYLNEKAKPFVEPLANELKAEIFLPCNVSKQEDIDQLFNSLQEKWGSIDFMIHAVAFAPLEDLHGKLIDSSRDGFLMAMDITCHSFIRLAKKSASLMQNGGSIFTMSYIGSEKVIENYNLMGPVKAALESSVRYLASELGPSAVRVHAISPGPIMTRAASGISEFDSLLEKAIAKTPLSKTLDIDDVGSLVAFLASDNATALTGNLIHIDCGYHVVG